MIIEYDDFLKNINTIIKNEEKHLYHSSMVTVMNMITTILIKKKHIDFKIDKVFINLSKNLDKLNNAELLPYTAKTVRIIKEIRKEIERDSRILISKTLQSHNIFNAGFAMITEHDREDSFIYNLYKSLLIMQKNDDMIIEKYQIELFKKFNSFRNVVAHSTGYDVFLNMNPQRLEYIKHLFNICHEEFLKIIFKNLEKVKTRMDELSIIMPKNPLKLAG